MSDTHGQAQTAVRAVNVLLRQRIDSLLHMGDVGSTNVIDALAVVNPSTGKPLDAHLVFGNTDFDYASLGDYATGLGIRNHHPVGSVETPRGKLVFAHGDDETAIIDALAAKAAYFCHGHTHVYAQRRVDQTLIINPGALFRANPYTVAVLDTEKETVEFYQVEHG